MNEWISVEDQLPDQHGMLVVVFDSTIYPNVWPAQWDAEHQTFSSNGGWFEKDEVTHWMPLPAPPAK